MDLVIEMCAGHVFGVVISTILKTYLHDQLGVLMFAILSMAQTIFTWIGADQDAGLIMFACFYGFFSAAVDSIHFTCQLTYEHKYNNSPTTNRMRWKMGLFFAAMSVGVVVGSVSAAGLIDYDNGLFWKADLISATGPFLGSLSFLASVALSKRGIVKEASHSQSPRPQSPRPHDPRSQSSRRSSLTPYV